MEDYDELIILEQEVADAIIENKKLICLLKIITSLKQQRKLSMKNKRKRIFTNSNVAVGRNTKFK